MTWDNLPTTSSNITRLKVVLSSCSSGQPGNLSIPVSASYSCGGVSGNTATVSAAIVVKAEVAQPTLTVPTATGNSPLFCYGESFTASANGPGGAQFTWSDPAGVSFTPQVSGPSQPVQVDLPYANYGYGDIRRPATPP